MEAKEVYKRVKELDLPKGKYAIFGSAPMCIRGLRSCHDIDIIVTGEIWNELKDKNWKVSKMPHGSEYLEKDGVELWKDWGPGEWDINKLIRDAEIINGVAFVRLDHVVEWKRLNGRKKDLDDVKIIEDYLKTKQKK